MFSGTASHSSGAAALTTHQDEHARLRGDVVVPGARRRKMRISCTQVMAADMTLAFEHDELLVLAVSMTGNETTRFGPQQNGLTTRLRIHAQPAELHQRAEGDPLGPLGANRGGAGSNER